jgi:CO/xanthine dehydrogenase Mo-binding subunit
LALVKEGLRVAQEIGWGEKLEPDCGIGVSCALKDGRGNYKISEARIEIDAHGKATLLEGTVEIWPGIAHCLRKIAAQELALPLSQLLLESRFSRSSSSHDRGVPLKTSLPGLLSPAIDDAG